MTPLAPEFDIMSGHDQYRCSDQINSHSDLGLSVDELKIGQKFKNKFERITVVKCWYINNSSQYKVSR